MSAVGQYLFTVIMAAFVFSVVCTVVGNKSPLSSIIRLIAGLFLTITALSPVLKINWDNFTEFTSSIQLDGASIVERETERVQSEKLSFIKQKTEAYVLEKANNLGLDITVSVSFQSAEQPLPTQIQIAGNAAPYAKRQLSSIIASDLGIPEECQIWN